MSGSWSSGLGTVRAICARGDGRRVPKNGARRRSGSSSMAPYTRRMAADPIVAIATAPGRGGIGIVRVSGDDLGPVIHGVLGPKAGQLAPRVALHAPFLAADGAAIDDGIAL